MAKTSIWMPLYIGDYMADTMHLTCEQHGAYMLLLMAYWRKGGPLPSSDAALAAICRMSPDAWSIAKAVLVEFFDTSTNGVWIHKRIEKELTESAKKKEKAEAKAKKAAEARWSKQEQCPKHAPSNAQEKHDECPSPSPSPSHDLSDDKSLKTHTETPKPEAAEESDKPDQKPTLTKGDLKKLHADIPPHLIDEWFVIRKDKRANSLTRSAWARIVSETEKAGISLADALRYCVNNHWRGFEAEWLRNKSPPAQRSLHSFDNVDYSKGVNPDGSF